MPEPADTTTAKSSSIATEMERPLKTESPALLLLFNFSNTSLRPFVIVLSQSSYHRWQRPYGRL
jgi:hypothetical protein